MQVSNEYISVLWQHGNLKELDAIINEDIEDINSDSLLMLAQSQMMLGNMEATRKLFQRAVALGVSRSKAMGWMVAGVHNTLAVANLCCGRVPSTYYQLSESVKLCAPHDGAQLIFDLRKNTLTNQLPKSVALNPLSTQATYESSLQKSKKNQITFSLINKTGSQESAASAHLNRDSCEQQEVVLRFQGIELSGKNRLAVKLPGPALRMIISSATLQHALDKSVVWSAEGTKPLLAISTEGHCLAVAHTEGVELVTSKAGATLVFPASALDDFLLYDLKFTVQMKQKEKHWLAPWIEWKRNARKFKRPLFSQIKEPALDEFASHSGASDYLKSSELGGNFDISIRSCHYIDRNNNVFWKGYDIDNKHYRNEAAVLDKAHPVAASGLAPSILNFSLLQHSAVFEFELCNGSAPELSGWPILSTKILDSLQRRLYSVTTTKNTFSEYLESLSQTISEYAEEFEPIHVFIHEKAGLDTYVISLCQVHGDMKLQNVIIQPDGQWLLVDWEASETAPMFVDALKCAMDYGRRTKNSKDVLNTLPVLKTFIETVVGEEAAYKDSDAILANLLAAAIHLVKQEVEWGNVMCLRTNYEMLLPLINAYSSFATSRN
ncbi:phosphotransferase [Desulfurispira natronophila]|uniref:Thiamine kinase-like enzyme n=1 Tax=Desulfurispira natronophila TaxID=682562 RepID=A0A7W7Y707_9BACT|nr:phosphotransferase [Desulfurispira natronophila]MBB5022902.1 thiamine kinase-like enzyme [Desulfurispira natronophila]